MLVISEVAAEEREGVARARAGLQSGVRVTLDLHSNFISHGSVHHDYNGGLDIHTNPCLIFCVAFKVFVGQETEFPLPIVGICSHSNINFIVLIIYRD